MSTTFQANLTDTEYNGWENYETWNVALWIQNDRSLYEIARECGDYQTFVKEVGVGYSTPDGVKYADPKVNVIELNSDVFDFGLTLKTLTVTYNEDRNSFNSRGHFLLQLGPSGS